MPAAIKNKMLLIVSLLRLSQHILLLWDSKMVADTDAKYTVSETESITGTSGDGKRQADGSAIGMVGEA